MCYSLRPWVQYYPMATSVTSVTKSKAASSEQEEDTSCRKAKEYGKPFRAACITQWKLDLLPEFEDIKHKIRFFAYSEECGEKTGKKHIQGFAYAHNVMRLTAWKKVFPKAHIEVMLGDFKSNEAYCSKQSVLKTFGDAPFQGQRKDLIDMKRKLDAGVAPLDLAEDDEYFGVVAKHHKFAETYFEHKRGKVLKTDRTEPNVYVLVGPTGCGKTSWCDKEFGPGNWAKLPAPNGGVWWWTPECCRSDAVVIDDVNSEKIPQIGTLLEWTDRYPFQAPVKGGFCWCKPRAVVLTSNIDQNLWWPNAKKEHMEAWGRRVRKCVTWSKP